MNTIPPVPRLKLRLDFGSHLTMGPGKADLLQAIVDHGSISAAGRQMGMSYKRAWTLVLEMNAAFIEPVVDSNRGGPGGGGAHLTKTGKALLCHFRRLETLLESQGSEDIDAIGRMLAPPG